MLRGRKRTVGWLIVAALVLFCSAGVYAAEEGAEPPPLPLHTIEGVGGLPLTPMAYLVNPGPEDELFGKPALAAHAVWIGDKDLQVLSIVETLYGRIELGYAASRLGLDDFDDDVRRATAGTTTTMVPVDGEEGEPIMEPVFTSTPGVDIGTDDINLHHFNLRVNLLPENACDTDWIPAVTAGAHYKYNDDVHEIDRDTGGVLRSLGYNDNDGVDFTLTATKTLTCLPRPVMVTAGARASKGAQLGYLGFTDDYLVTFEGSVLMLATDRLAVGAEYRQKGDDLDEIPGLINKEDSWWDVHAAYILNPNAEIYATYGNAGHVLNHSDENLWGLVFKYEF